MGQVRFETMMSHLKMYGIHLRLEFQAPKGAGKGCFRTVTFPSRALPLSLVTSNPVVDSGAGNLPCADLKYDMLTLELIQCPRLIFTQNNSVVALASLAAGSLPGFCFRALTSIPFSSE